MIPEVGSCVMFLDGVERYGTIIAFDQSGQAILHVEPSPLTKTEYVLRDTARRPTKSLTVVPREEGCARNSDCGGRG